MAYSYVSAGTALSQVYSSLHDSHSMLQSHTTCSHTRLSTVTSLAFYCNVRLTFCQAIQFTVWLMHSARQVGLLQVIGAPLAAGLLALDGYLGLAGWQWLFIVEGIPTVLMGVYTKVNLAESPAKASFLTPAEKAWLQQRHADSKVPIVLSLLWPFTPALPSLWRYASIMPAERAPDGLAKQPSALVFLCEALLSSQGRQPLELQDA